MTSSSPVIKDLQFELLKEPQNTGLKNFHYVQQMQSSQIIYTPKHSPLAEVCLPSASIKSWSKGFEKQNKRQCASLCRSLCQRAHSWKAWDALSCGSETVPPTVLRITKRFGECCDISFVLKTRFHKKKHKGDATMLKEGKKDVKSLKYISFLV